MKGVVYCSLAQAWTGKTGWNNFIFFLIDYIDYPEYFPYN